MPDTALVIIDMQLSLISGAYREHDVLSRIGALASRCRKNQVPVIYLQHNHATYRPMMKGQPGWHVHPTIKPHDQDHIIEKEASDAFYGTELEAHLRSLGISTLLIAGAQTEYCVDATARAALSRGFDVILLSDCHTTGDSVLSAEAIVQHHNTILPQLAHPKHGIKALTSSEVLFDERPA